MLLAAACRIVQKKLAEFLPQDSSLFKSLQQSSNTLDLQPGDVRTVATVCLALTDSAVDQVLCEEGTFSHDRLYVLLQGKLATTIRTHCHSAQSRPLPDPP